jgi:hypothetical protein
MMGATVTSQAGSAAWSVRAAATRSRTGLMR